MLNFRSPLQKESCSDSSAVANFTDGHYLNMLQSTGQSVYTYDRNAKITYWNRNAEKLYGYTAPEALGRDFVELIADVQGFKLASGIIDVVTAGGSWSGELPAKSKRGERFMVITTHTPVFADNGTLCGIICVSSTLWNSEDTRCEPHVALPSNITDLVSKISDKPESGSRDDIMDGEGRSGDRATSSFCSSPRRNNVPKSVSGVFFNSKADENFHFESPSLLQTESHKCDGVNSDFREEPEYSNFTEKQYMNIFQSMGQSVHIMDRNYRIIFWNRGAEQIYGYTDLEALGCDVRELLAEVKDFQHATNIIDLSFAGEIWTGKFPVTSKKGEKIVIVATATPLYDDNGTLFGVVSIAADSRDFQKSKSQPFPTQFEHDFSVISKPGCIDPHQPVRVAVSSKISDLASKVSNKVKSKMWNGENIVGYNHISNNMEDAKISAVLREPPPAVFGSFYQSGVEAHLPMKRPRDYYNYHFSGEKSESRLRFIQTGKGTSAVQLGWACDMNKQKSALCDTSPSNNCTTSTSISDIITQLDIFNYDGLPNYEIEPKDLKRGKQIGQGSCGTVYHGQWNRSDVAIKVFSALDFPNDLILSFNQEVSFMKKLRHPNVLPFLGSLTSPDHLCIVSEFLARGSLFRLLHRSNSKLDWRCRVQLAFDIAQGMNYLHHCTPPIVHHNLKSSNVLVGKNWNVKVGDYGLSHLRHQAFLVTKTGKGTPQWMAPEVMRTKPSNEKSDIYSFGVILWELATQKIPWDNLNPMQVIGAVGFMGRRLDIPKDIDPLWAAIIESCWVSIPEFRPTFDELLERLKLVLAAVGQM